MWKEKAARNPNDVDAWTKAYREINGRPPMHLPALAAIADDQFPMVVVRKSAQVGMTEAAMNVAFHAADTGYADRGNVLFLNPTQGQMDDFVNGRMNNAIQASPYLRMRLQPEPPRRKGADSTRLKRLGKGLIYCRGSESKRQIASVDADVVIFDEFDQMAEGVLELGKKRIASSKAGRLLVLSTPRLPESGIDGLYMQSDQRRYCIPCPSCGLEQALEWELNVDFECARVVCRGCRADMNVIAEGRWKAEAPGNERIHGYTLNRLYSPWANIPEMIEASKATTLFAVQEFRNSDLGEPYSPPGGGVSVDDLDRCRSNYGFDDYRGQACNMGVDVGLKLHVVIRERKPNDLKRGEVFKSRLWFAAEVDSFEEVEALMPRFNVKAAVVDSQPDLHAARSFADRHRTAWLAQYSRHTPGHEPVRGRHGREPNIFNVNRLEALDAMYDRIRNRLVSMPRDARALGGRVKDGVGEYYREMRAPKRTIDRDGQGNLVPKWDDHGRDDHYAHAEVYCMLAGTAPIGGRVVGVWGIG